MTVIRPVDVPEIRTEISTWLDTGNAAELWFKMAKAGNYDWLPFNTPSRNPSEAGSVLRGTEILRLQESALFYVTADMVDLAVAAAASIPDYQLAPEDLPSPAGFMVFEQPVVSLAIGGAQLGVTAVCWASIPGHDTVLLGTVYLDRAEAGPVFARLAPNRDMARSEPRLVYGHGGEFLWEFGDNVGLSLGTDNFMATLAPRLRAAWLLMQQESLADTSPVPLPRPVRRRLERAGQEPPEVRLIELRRPKRTGGTTDATTDREYHHRWIVRGHWRSQWYPARQVHRPLWIAPHVKGPEDKPLLGGEKVHVWKR